MREIIRDLVQLARAMMEREVVVRKLCEPACLSTVQLLRLVEVLEVLVVRPDLKLGCAFEEVAPMLKREHDRE